MRLFDSHCHIDFAVFDHDRAAVLGRARDAFVQRLLVAGVGPEQWDKFGDLGAAHPELSFALGVHPGWIERMNPGELADALSGLRDASERTKAVAIGECGFDRAAQKRGISFEQQSEVTQAQLEVANRCKLPVVFHILGAHDVALRFFKEHGPPESGGVVHSYSGSAELVPRYEELGLHLSFAASVTRSNARKSLAAAAAVSPGRLLIETDSPDQLPTGAAPCVSKRNEPSFLRSILTAVASARGQSEEEVGRVTFDNAAALYDPAVSV